MPQNGEFVFKLFPVVDVGNSVRGVEHRKNYNRAVLHTILSLAVLKILCEKFFDDFIKFLNGVYS